MFKKCVAANCSRIAWFSDSGMCKKCEKEAHEIMVRIGQSRNSGNRSFTTAAVPNNHADFERLQQLQTFTTMVNDSSTQSTESNECSSAKHYDSTPSYSSNDSYGSCSSDSGYSPDSGGSSSTNDY